MSNSDLTSITLHSQQPLEMRLVDGRMMTVARGVGSLGANLQAGIYKLELRAGFNYQEQLLELLPGIPLLRDDITLPFTSTLPGASSRHATLLNQLSLGTALDPEKDAQFLLFLRPIPSSGEDGSSLKLRETADWSRWTVSVNHRFGVRNSVYSGLKVIEDCAGFCINTVAGSSILRITAPGKASSIEFPVYVTRGWQTIVCLPVSNGQPRYESIQIQMLRINSPMAGYLASLDSTGNLALCREMAVTGLASGHLLVPRDQIQQMVDSMVYGKFSDPMLGVLGAYSMFEQLPPGQATPQRHYQLALSDTTALLDTVLENLNRLLPGHPDVAGLRALRSQILANPATPQLEPEDGEADFLDAPPMLFMGYRALLDLDRNEVSSFQLRGLADIARAFASACGPWTCWRAGDADDLYYGSQQPGPPDDPADVIPGSTSEAHQNRALEFLQQVARTEDLTLPQALDKFSNDQLSEAASVSTQSVGFLRATLEHSGSADRFASLAGPATDDEDPSEFKQQMGSR